MVAISMVVMQQGSACAAAKHLRINRESIARVLAGLPVREGTLALIRERLSVVETSEGSPSSDVVQASAARALRRRGI